MTSRIATLTLNPAIDASAETEAVRPTHKTRTFDERMDPGGGGINVARVLQRFGAPVHAIFLAGGITGRVLDDLLRRAGVERTLIAVDGETRMSLTVHERSTGLEYRFVPDGPELAEHEWQAALDEVEALECDYLVASGSLPDGVPVDFYGRVCTMLSGRPTRFIVDTSGPALREALACGQVFLIKPSQSELEQFADRALPAATI
jgi:6-phosphofructokinase 2